jgi:hypothetical protein
MIFSKSGSGSRGIALNWPIELKRNFANDLLHWAGCRDKDIRAKISPASPFYSHLFIHSLSFISQR